MLTYLLGDVLRIFSGDAEKMFAEQARARNGYPAPDFAVFRESLGKHYRSHILVWF
jgi:hypothetical protein